MKKMIALTMAALAAASFASGDAADDAEPMPSASSFETTNAANGTVTKTFLAADGKTVTGRYSFRLPTATNEVLVAGRSTVPEVPEGTAWVRTKPDAYENPRFAYMPKIELDGHGGISATAADGKEYLAYGFRRGENPGSNVLRFTGSGWMCSGPLYNSQKEIDRPNPHFRVSLMGVDGRDLGAILKTGSYSSIAERHRKEWRLRPAPPGETAPADSRRVR